MKLAIVVSFIIALTSFAFAESSKVTLPAESPPDDSPDTKLATPDSLPVDLTPKRIKVRAIRKTGKERFSEAPHLAGMRVLSVTKGEARVTLEGKERVLRPGDSVGPDTVRSIAEDHIALLRSVSPENPGGEALVLMRFDSQGQGRVSVFWRKNPKGGIPPDVR